LVAPLGMVGGSLSQEGFNSKALTLVVVTRNGGGIGAGSDIVISYGDKFDFTAGRNVAQPKYVGLLERLFQEQLAKQRDTDQGQKREACASACQLYLLGFRPFRRPPNTNEDHCW
jgi:hypothetical protein